jgi:hypothetical protein
VGANTIGQQHLRARQGTGAAPHLALGSLSNDTLAVGGEGDHGGCGAGALRVFDDTWRLALHDRHTRVSRAEVDTNDVPLDLGAATSLDACFGASAKPAGEPHLSMRGLKAVVSCAQEVSSRNFPSKHHQTLASTAAKLGNISLKKKTVGSCPRSRTGRATGAAYRTACSPHVFLVVFWLVTKRQNGGLQNAMDWNLSPAASFRANQAVLEPSMVRTGVGGSDARLSMCDIGHQR